MSGQQTGAIVGLVVGAVAGYFIGPIGPYLGASIGSALGSLAGGVYDTATAPDIRNEQENIGDFFVQTSSLGTAIPQLIGHERFAGNVFYLGERFVVEHEETPAGGGKGGGGAQISVTKTYEVDIGIALTDTRIFGPVAGIRKIWRDGTLWKTQSNGDVASNTPWEGVTFYPGTLDQNPDPTMEAVKGIGNVPGYPYLCYVVLDNYDMGNYPRVPTFTFELYQDRTPLSAGHQLMQRASSGELFAASPATNEVIVYDATTQDQTHAISVSSELPYSTTRGFIMGWQNVSSYLWVGNPRDYTLTRINAATKLTTDTISVPYSLLSGGVYTDSDMWFCAYDYSTNLGYLLRVNNGGIVATIPSGQARGGQMKVAVGTGGNLWVTDNHYPDGGGNSGITRVGFATNAIMNTVVLGTAAASSPIDVAIAPVDGNVWVLDAQAATVIRVDQSAGAVSATLALGGTPLQLGVASDGYIWAATTLDGGTVYRVDPVTNAVQTFGSLALSLPSPAHTLWSPGPSGSMWLLSVPDWTVQLFDTTGARTLRNLEGQPRGLVAEGTTSAMTLATNGQLERTAVDGTRAAAASLQLPRLRAVITALCGAAGLTPAEINVTGIPNPMVAMKIVNVVAARGPLEQLLQAYQLYAYESNLQIMFQTREPGGIVASIAEDELDARDADTEAAASQGLLITRIPDDGLPTEIRLSYVSRSRNYQQNTQVAYMTTSRAPASNSRAISVPIVLTERQAIRLVREALDQIWIQRTSYKFAVNRDYAYLEPGDRIEVTSRGVTHTMVISEVNYGRPGLMECSARSDIDGAVNVLTSHPGASSATQRLGVAAHTTGQFLNLPAMESADQTPRYHVAYEHASSAWAGATLHRSVDSGSTYLHVASATRRGTVGTVATALSDAPTWYVFDDVSTFTVVLVSGTLQSASDEELYAGSNLVFLGSEVLQFGTATLIATLTYTCSHLLRGRRGTEWASTNHTPDERFVLLNTSVGRVDMIASERNRTRDYKTVTGGTSISAVTATTFAATSENLISWSVAGPEALRTGNDWVFTWEARSRFSGVWADGVAFGYDPDFLSFRVHIYSDATYETRVRRIDVSPALDPGSVQTVTYTSAQQVSDFGSNQSTIYYRIFQMNSYGLGRAMDLVGV